MRPITLVFILTCVVYAYPYLIYPLVLRILVRAGRSGRKPEETPIGSMTHIICAHNEEQHIRLKLTNAFEIAPAVDQQVLLVCDGCTDSTPEIAEEIAATRPELTVISTSHIGKSAAQNLAVKQATGDAIVFSDADTLLGTQTLQKLLGDLAGGHACVGANVQYGGEHTPDALYNRLEARLKTLQGALGMLIGVHGACYAVWKKHFTELDSAALSDLALPLELLLAGRKVGFSSCAMAYEHSERADPGRNLAIRRRIFCRALTTLLGRGYLKRAFGKPWVFFHMVSDKIMRYFIGPLSAAVLVLAGLVGGPTLAVVLAGVLVVCLLAMIPDASRSGIAAKLNRASTFLIIVNLASLLAAGDYLSGRSYSKW